MGQGRHFIPRFTGPWASSGMANPSPSSHSSFWVLAHSPSPLVLPSKQTHSFIYFLSPSPSLSSTLFPIWPQGSCVALKQALLIEHLFRHGAGSAACGRAAGGSSRGDIMSYYISWYVLFTRMRAYLHAPMETHAATIPSKIIVASIWLKNVETQTGSFTRLF